MPLTLIELQKGLTHSVNNIQEMNDPKALSIVKDEIIAFNELLGFGKGAFNGALNQEINMTVNPGDDLPVLYNTMVITVEGGQQFALRVTEIRTMRWLEGGGVQVNVLGTVSPYVAPENPVVEDKPVPADVVVEELPKPKRTAKRK